jgi:DNA-binding XRE family transcriptional regulator
MSAATIIKEMRITLCMEQEEFANELGISKSSICNYEKGRGVPRLSIIRKIRALAKKHGLPEIAAKEFLIIKETEK